MNAVQESGRDVVSSAGELLDLLVQCAKPNRRPDLTRRLHQARLSLDAAAEAADSPEAVVRQVAGEALRALDSLAVDLRTRRATLGDDGRARRLRSELDALRTRSEEFTQASREWPHLLAHNFAKVGADLEFELRTRLRALVDETELAIEAS